MISISRLIMILGCALWMSACSGNRTEKKSAVADPAPEKAPEKTPEKTPDKTPDTLGGQAAPEPAPPTAQIAVGEPAPGTTEAAGKAAGKAAGRAAEGRDFIDEARILYRVVACAGDQPIPDHLDKAVVAAHCKRLMPRKQHYRERYVKGAQEFIAKLRPADLPQVVVYPFGGGDLISALVAFPDAVEITTLSLELAGDPRRIGDLDSDALRDNLAAISIEIGGMLSVSNNTSKNMSAAHQNLLPAQLSSFLIALAVHGYEPTSVRYFKLADDGTVHYLSDSDIAAVADERARQLKHDWAEPNFSPAFSNVELQFKPVGAGPDEPVRIHRHIAANLADAHLADDSPVLAHLRAKGKVAAMTKAASYLLWRGDFSRIRDYLLGHMVWMLSDSTGIPPAYAKAAGMKQTTYGQFSGSFLTGIERHNEDFRALWSSQPYRRVPFRFGYVDAEKRAHLLITAPAAK